MRIIDLGRYRRARVWIGEVPDAAYRSIDIAKCSMLAGTNIRDGLRLAAIEVSVPVGAHSMYGLLGGEFNPESTDRLDVEVRVASAVGHLLAANLAGQGDEVRVGLPAEYTEAVLSGIALAKGELGRLVPGRLLINRAAHGAVGSCEAVFKHLAAALVKLFNIEGQSPSDSELVSLFPSTFS
jgi:hypothetical protein